MNGLRSIPARAYSARACPAQHARPSRAGKALAFVAALATLGHAAAAQSFTLTGHAPGGEASVLTGLSDDGRSACGYTFNNSTDMFVAFRWTAESGRVDFGLQPDLPARSFARGMSGSGTAVVGDAGASFASGFSTFRWSGPGTFQSLGTLPGAASSMGLDASFDGSVVVGKSYTSVGPSTASVACRWTPAGGVQALGYTRPTHYLSESRAVSRDGGTVVGFSAGGGSSDAFVWREETGLMEALPALPGSQAGITGAYGANGTGDIIVGSSGAFGNMTMWVGGQPIDLGRIPNFGHTLALAVSDTGNVVAGTGQGPGGLYATVWTPQRGSELLSQFLECHGVAIPAGMILSRCTGISADGLTLAGVAETATSVEGFIATIPSPGGTLLVVFAGFSAAFRRNRSV